MHLTDSKALRRRLAPAVAVAAALLAATALPARADLTADYDGRIAQPKGRPTVPMSVAITQSGKSLLGTGELKSGDPALDGIYAFTGKNTGKKVRLVGQSPLGAKLTFQGKIAGTSVAGRVKVKGGGAKLNGKLSLTANVSTGDGSSCDAVYTANKDFFDTQVMPVMTGVCSTCHVDGGQAAAARLRVTAGDALATARTTVHVIDSASPGTSRLIDKPTDVIPHGGGPQLAVGSAQADALAQWAGFIASAHCAP